MNFLIDLFKRAVKGDSYRAVASPDKYNDHIAQLNSQSPNQYSKLSTANINKIQKTSSALTQTETKGSTLPGTI
jgi:hypothetical protein